MDSATSVDWLVRSIVSCKTAEFAAHSSRKLLRENRCIVSFTKTFIYKLNIVATPTQHGTHPLQNFGSRCSSVVNVVNGCMSLFPRDGAGSPIGMSDR